MPLSGIMNNLTTSQTNVPGTVIIAIDIFFLNSIALHRLELQLEPDVSTSLPSPAPSLNEHLPPTDPGSFSTSYVDSAAPVSRKRRLSDADSQGAPKRPRNILSGPRLHSVSDPLPSSSALSAWFENHFGIPSTVTADDPNVSLPFDVELYDYSTIASGLKPLLGTVDACTSIFISSYYHT